MQRLRQGLGQVMIVYASTLHVSWGIISLIDNSAFNSTALSGVVNIFGFTTTWVLFIVGIMAAGALRLKESAFMRLFLMLPQQAVLVISAYTAGTAIWLGAYADGTVRPWEFIMADQMPALLAAICYSVAIIQNGLHLQSYH